MSAPALLLPIPVLLPLGLATIMLALAHWLPSRLSNLLAILAAVAVAALCSFLAAAALHGSVLQWFGGWTPASSGRPGVVLGISFVADPASAAVAAFIGVLFAAALVFAWGYSDLRSHFQILMLLFLAAMVGFCLTHDLFNLFVWFELMSVAAFALTAYPLGQSSLEGAFNFTVTNALASFMMLAGIGLLYARTGTLDFTQMGRDVAKIGDDTVISAGFCLIAAALLTKAAIVPFHMWLSDAHAVAPSPVSVIFSGAMVSIALFVLAKLISQVFIGNAQVMALVHSLLPGLGAMTALIGGGLAWAQRHLKRMLAFSTIAHLGIMLIGVAAVAPGAMAAFVLYLFGHGLVKAALFMIAGILLSLCASADEVVLYGRAKHLWPAGAAMLAGGMLLGGLPIGLLHHASDAVETGGAATTSAITISTALTGAAVLRAAARIFIGASGTPGPEITAPTEREREKANRPFWTMLLPCILLLLLALLPGAPVMRFLDSAARRMMDVSKNMSSASSTHPGILTSFSPIVLTIALVAFALVRRRPTAPLARRLFGLELWPYRTLQFLHSGLVGDYIAWMVVGLAVLALAVRR